MQSRQHVTRAGRCQPDGGFCGDGGPAVGRGDDAAGAFQDDDSAGLGSGRAGHEGEAFGAACDMRGLGCAHFGRRQDRMRLHQTGLIPSLDAED